MADNGDQRRISAAVLLHWPVAEKGKFVHRAVSAAVIVILATGR
jgi:hypothetical protein